MQVKRAYQRSNLLVVGPDTGLIGGRRDKWRPSESPSFMDGVFELKDVTLPAGGVSKVGRMKIGDFASFCQFLESMTS
jgi:hypothetical protein